MLQMHSLVSHIHCNKQTQNMNITSPSKTQKEKVKKQRTQELNSTQIVSMYTNNSNYRTEIEEFSLNYFSLVKIRRNNKGFNVYTVDIRDNLPQSITK